MKPRSQLGILVVLVLLSLLAAPASSQQISQGGLTTANIAATLGQVFMGPFEGSVAFTRVLVTNRDLNAYGAQIIFHQGAVVGQAIPFINGDRQFFANVNIPQGGIAKFDLTADQLLIGAAAIIASPPCTAGSLSVQGAYFIGNSEDPELQPAAAAPDQLNQSSTIRPNDSNTWLKPGNCVAVPTNQGTDNTGIKQDLGIAVSSVHPGQHPPTGTFLDIQLFDEDGQCITEFHRNVTGQHDPFFPAQPFTNQKGGTTMIFCLESNDPNYNLDLSSVRVNQRGPVFEFDAAIFADGFESGDVSAWNR